MLLSPVRDRIAPRRAARVARHVHAASACAWALRAPAQVDAVADQRQRVSRFAQLCDERVAAADVDGLKALASHLLREEVEMVVSRPALTHFAEAALAGTVDGVKPGAGAGAGMGDEWRRELCQFFVDSVAARAASFHEADAIARRALADIMAEAEDYAAAAKVLGAVNVETAGRTYTDDEKCELYVRVAELFLMDDMTVEAETYINRASSVFYGATDRVLKMRYRVSYAQVLDAKRRFLDAAVKYYELSQIEDKDVDENDIAGLLAAAATCVILAPAGPQRQRLMGTMYRDSRSSGLEHFDVLEKMYMERLLKPLEVTRFGEGLAPHQRAVLADGATVLQRAVMEHNMLAASRVYRNVSFEQLAALLGCEADKAEKVAATMIAEARLSGTIDQMAGMLDFALGADEGGGRTGGGGGGAAGHGGGAAGGGGADMLGVWDTQIKQLCSTVNTVSEAVLKAHPTLT